MKRLIPPAAKPLRHRGQTLVLMVLVLPAFMAAMGLATDVANFYFNYVKVQTGADASVLSGAKYLPDQPGAAISAATTYATSFNGIAAAEILSITTSYDPTLCPSPGSPPPAPVPGCKLTMTVQRIVPYYFGRLVGVNSGTMNVTATAAAGVPASSINYGLMPIGVQAGTPLPSPYNHDGSATLPFVQGPTGAIPPGSFSALGCIPSLSCTAPANCAVAGGTTWFSEDVLCGYTGKVSLAEPAPNDRSVTSGVVGAALMDLVNLGNELDPGGTYLSHTATDPRVATVAFVNYAACCNVQAFAQLWINSVSPTGGITGNWIASGVNGAPDTTGTVPNAGALAITLAN
jgi:Flp pilus assembly protein TadG